MFEEKLKEKPLCTSEHLCVTLCNNIEKRLRRDSRRKHRVSQRHIFEDL